MDGMTLTDGNGETACLSKYCAKDGISKVVSSRIAMAAPGMFALPVIMEKLETQKWFKSRPFLHAPFQVMGCGCFLIFMVPVACSLWPQTIAISSESLRNSDPDAFKQMQINMVLISQNFCTTIKVYR